MLTRLNLENVGGQYNASTQTLPDGARSLAPSGAAQPAGPREWVKCCQSGEPALAPFELLACIGCGDSSPEDRFGGGAVIGVAGWRVQLGAENLPYPAKRRVGQGSFAECASVGKHRLVGSPGLLTFSTICFELVEQLLGPGLFGSEAAKAAITVHREGERSDNNQTAQHEQTHTQESVASSRILLSLQFLGVGGRKENKGRWDPCPPANGWAIPNFWPRNLRTGQYLLGSARAPRDRKSA